MKLNKEMKFELVWIVSLAFVSFALSFFFFLEKETLEIHDSRFFYNRLWGVTRIFGILLFIVYSVKVVINKLNNLFQNLLVILAISLLFLFSHYDQFTISSLIDHCSGKETSGWTVYSSLSTNPDDNVSILSEAAQQLILALRIFLMVYLLIVSVFSGRMIEKRYA